MLPGTFSPSVQDVLEPKPSVGIAKYFFVLFTLVLFVWNIIAKHAYLDFLRKNHCFPCRPYTQNHFAYCIINKTDDTIYIIVHNHKWKIWYLYVYINKMRYDILCVPVHNIRCVRRNSFRHEKSLSPKHLKKTTKKSQCKKDLQ